ncbi:MAG: formate dehydrogenase subunit delta [Gammaproteobacteria bacterium]|nr:formate dehydrogenase subunit delta [Gammaproteobacteria bacterium]
MDVRKLVRMANQIAANLDYGPNKEQVVYATADHLRRFWSPSMLQLIVEHYRSGDAELSDLASRAVARLAEEQQNVA